MSRFEKIKLPPLLIADLYGKHLVLIEKGAAKKTAAAPVKATLPTVPEIAKPAPAPLPLPPVEKSAQLHVLGGFQKQVAIALHSPDAVHTDDASLDLLNKMLIGLKMSMADVAIINMDRNHLNFPFQINGLPPKVVILFGVESAELQLPLSLPHFQPNSWSQCTWLFSPPLPAFNVEGPDQKNLKTSLWNALKKVFMMP